MMGMYPHGQTTVIVYYDDRSTGTTVTTQWPPYSGSGMGRSRPAKLSPEAKMERARQEKIEHEKAIKRKVLGPKRSRWG